MSDIVTEDDLSALAGEYVLGTLDPTERSRANVLLDVDQRFRGLVRVWERRLGDLHLMVEPVAPDGRVLQRIRGKLGLTPAEPALASAPAVARSGAPAVAKAEVTRSAEIEPAVEVKAAEVRPDEVAPERVNTAGVEDDAAELDEAQPARQFSELIQEVERYTETMRGGAWPSESALSERGPPPERPVTKPSPKPESKLEAKPESKLEAKPEPKPATKPDAKLESTPEVKPEPKPEVKSESEPEAKLESKPERGKEEQEMQRILREAAARDAAAAALVAVEEAREHLRNRPQRVPPRGWRTVALLMTFLAAGLSGLIAAWRFAPDRLPPPLRPMVVLNIPEGVPGHRPPAGHGTQFEE